MDQDQYRAINHFRAAIMRESGESILVDDVTFNAELHEELPAPIAPPAE